MSKDFFVNQSFSGNKLLDGKFIEFVGLVDFSISTFSPHTCNKGFLDIIAISQEQTFWK